MVAMGRMPVAATPPSAAPSPCGGRAVTSAASESEARLGEDAAARGALPIRMPPPPPLPLPLLPLPLLSLLCERAGGCGCRGGVRSEPKVAVAPPRPPPWPSPLWPFVRLEPAAGGDERWCGRPLLPPATATTAVVATVVGGGEVARPPTSTAPGSTTTGRIGTTACCGGTSAAVGRCRDDADPEPDAEPAPWSSPETPGGCDSDGSTMSAPSEPAEKSG